VADPLDVLRLPALPESPDPRFASRLRARLERVLDLPEGVTVIDLALEDLEPPAPAAAAPSVLAPYLAVRGAEAALRWYADVLDARPLGAPIVMPDGRIGHAELQIGGATLMLSEEHPEIGVAAPDPARGVAVTIHLTVSDVDTTMDRALAAGARLERPPSDHDYGRNGVLRDPFGHRWMLSTEPAPAPAPEDTPAPVADRQQGGLRHGDIGYASLWVPDAARAAVFFEAVLGWRWAPGAGEQHRQVEGLTLHHGLWGGVEPATLFCCFAVRDVDAAVEAVRSAGGAAGPPEAAAFGTVSNCEDDQGQPFAVFEPPGGTADPSTPGLDPSRPGDLTYVTMEVPDSARARAFYGAVLGWRFAPGSVEDGWQVESPAPLVGLSGGHSRPVVVPFYRVADITAAVGLVRDRGGTATDPEAQPYGITATCADDQGTRFYLGQL
jgi:uncharacterized glyoxalase superfamily protein PhnB